MSRQTLCRLLWALFAVCVCRTAMAQHMRLDSILVLNSHQYNKIVLDYDSLGQYLQCRTWRIQKKQLPFSRYEYTYDKNNRLVRKDRYETKENSRLITEHLTQKTEYRYNRKGRLKERVRYAPISNRIWKGDKIVRTDNPWREIGRDRCDRHGNIILYRDYDSADTLLYTYTADHKVQGCERRTGDDDEVRHTYYNYDQWGDLLSMETNDNRSKQLISECTYLCYNVFLMANEVPGLSDVMKILSEEFDCLSVPELDYTQTFVHAPIKIAIMKADCDGIFWEYPTAYFHYSYVMDDDSD